MAGFAARNRRRGSSTLPASLAKDGQQRIAEYVVRDGDSLFSIAKSHGIPSATLLAMNGLSWSTGVSPGQRLAMPAWALERPATLETEHAITRHSVEAGETVSRIAARFDIPLEVLLSANGLHRRSPIFIGQLMIIPEVHPSSATGEAGENEGERINRRA